MNLLLYSLEDESMTGQERENFRSFEGKFLTLLDMIKFNASFWLDLVVDSLKAEVYSLEGERPFTAKEKGDMVELWTVLSKNSENAGCFLARINVSG